MANSTKRDDQDLTAGSVSRHLTRLTIPMFLGISSMIVASMIDTVFVGWLGTLELAAVSFTFPLVMALSSVSMGLGIGATSIMSRTLGSGDRTRCLLIGTHTLILVTLLIAVVSVVGYASATDLFAVMGAGEDIRPISESYVRIWFLGLPFFALPMVGGMMLRSLGDAKTPGILMTASAVIQVVIAPPLIFGVGGWDGLGVNGSAWAFVLSRLVTFVYSIHVFWKYGLFHPPGTLRSVISSWWEVMRIGVPSMLVNLIGPASMTILMSLLAAHGHVVVAAFGVAVRIESLAMMIVMSLSSSVSPFVGQNYGAGEHLRIRRALSLSYRFTLAWGVFAFVVLALFGRAIVGSIVDDPGVIEATYDFLLIVPLTFGLMGVSMVAGGYFIALGMPMPSFVIAVLRMVVVLIPLAFLLDAVWGYRGIFGANAASNVVVGVVAYVWVRWTVPRKETSVAGKADRGSAPAAAMAK